ncbi:hypothetical protein BpHYR1_042379 [Brachionus plicatilis]|uniref:Uncharacterized protein n=1 Tax=Brachionus plicatilis TaxID=10195 RepID=A0A3M7QDG4_BRAPC|nr:hypothetical protein BpHYR1_042379 [Brachionus plicatilis]
MFIKIEVVINKYIKKKKNSYLRIFCNAALSSTFTIIMMPKTFRQLKNRGKKTGYWLTWKKQYNHKQSFNSMTRLQQASKLDLRRRETKINNK